jgi:hypothetical protein
VPFKKAPSKKVPFKKVSMQKHINTPLETWDYAKNCRDSTAISGGRE